MPHFFSNLGINIQFSNFIINSIIMLNFEKCLQHLFISSLVNLYIISNFKKEDWVYLIRDY